MALNSELTKILYNEDEPLPKRLKIADNAFQLNNLYLQSKEVYLFNWIINVKDGDENAWNFFSNWLCSEHMSNLSKIDLSLEFMNRICNTVLESLNSNQADNNIRTLRIKSAFALINNSLFHEYFKLHLKEYFTLLARVMEMIDNRDRILELLTNENVFDKLYFTSEKFYKYFFEILLNALSEVDCKFKDDKVFQKICSLIQKIIFRKFSRNIDAYLQHFFENATIPKCSMLKYFTKSLFTNYVLTTESSVNSFRILFACICQEYSHNFSNIYQFSILLFHILGFNLSEKFNLVDTEKLDILDQHICRSLKIMVSVLKILSIYKNDLNLEINHVKFSEFIGTIVLTTINFSSIPNENSLEVIYYCMEINPLIIDSLITEVLQYILLRENNCYLIYIKLMTSIFKVFSKLHRVHNLISKMLPIFKELNEEKIHLPNIVPFNGNFFEGDIKYERNVNNIFPPEIFNAFKECVSTAASWQVMNLFKAFLHHLNVSINNNLQDISKDEHKLIYMEVTGIFLCEFLSTVRVVEHTTPDLVMNKFLKAIDELKAILGKFGNDLISMEHNHTLMKTYLSICCTSGELYMALHYYSISTDVLLPKIEYKNDAISNISYLHPYLTPEQWSLISERVTNFGKTTCKQMMQNLFIQYIKNMSLFENRTSDEMINVFIKNFMLSLHDLWENIIHDSFILNTLLSKMQSSQIVKLSETILKKIVESEEDLQLSREILNSKVLPKYLVYNILINISKLFKFKEIGYPLCIQIFAEFDINLFSEEYNEELLQNLLIKFNNIVLKDLNCQRYKINLKKLSVYINILKSIPMIYLPDVFKIYSTLYLITVLNDLRSGPKYDSEIVDNLEILIIGLLRTMPKHFSVYVKHGAVILCIIKNIKNYAKAFAYYLDNLHSTNNFIEQFYKLFSHLIASCNKNKDCEKYIKCIEILLSALLKYKKGKITPDQKTNILDCFKKIYDELTKLILHKDVYSRHLYALVMKHHLSTGNEEIFLEFKKCYDRSESLLEFKEENCEGTLLLLTTMIENKSKFKDLTVFLRHWVLQEDIKIPKTLKKEQSQLTVLSFEYFSKDNFTEIMQQLSEITLSATCEDRFIKFMNIWMDILACNFNPIKQNIFLQKLHNLLQEISVCENYFSEENKKKKIVEFAIHIAQTTHIQPTPAILDIIILIISDYIQNSSMEVYTLCIKLLDTLLKSKKSLITDRLPSCLQQYRSLLQILCRKSNANLPQQDLDCLANSAHSMEMLTKNVVTYGKYVARMSPYVIADILQHYESISLFPAVKMHIDNCVYSLLELCDQHAVSYLMRILSTASTEMFKFLFENFNRYYRYKGKV